MNIRLLRVKENGGKLTKQDKIFLLEQADRKCQKCGNPENLTFDHVVPVALGGSSNKENMQILCRYCNFWKGARSTADYRGTVRTNNFGLQKRVSQPEAKKIKKYLVENYKIEVTFIEVYGLKTPAAISKHLKEKMGVEFSAQQIAGLL